VYIIYEPVIKWSGSKRSQAENILKHFPKEIDTYYEPFCGGASVVNPKKKLKKHLLKGVNDVR
jgi:DNA adenine methylase